MDKKKTFEEKIESTFVRHGRIPFIVSAAMVGLLLVGYYLYTNYYQVYIAQQEVTSELLHMNTLISDSFAIQEQDSYVALEDDINKVYEMYYKLNNQLNNHLSVVIFNEKNIPIFITQPSLQGGHYERYYQSLILTQLDSVDVLTTTMPLQTSISSPRVVIARKSVDNIGNPIKVLFFISPEYFEDIIENQRNNHIVLTDKFNNVIATTSSDFVEGGNKFDPIKKRLELPHIVYRVRSSNMSEQFSVSVLTPKLYVTWQLVMVAVLFLATFVLIQRLNRKSAKKIGNDVSESINTLMDAVEAVNRGSLDLSIGLNTGDEFETLAHAFENMGHKLSEAITNNERLLESSKNAEIKQLEAQFNPHFLYNSLEVIRYLMIDDPKRAEALILGVTKLLRYSIRRGSNTVPLREDIEYIKLYLEVHKLRLQNRFNYTIDVEEDVLDISLPKLILQPLIENCIKHGYKNQTILNVGVMAYSREQDVYLHVIDNGCGMDPDYVKRLNNFDGVYNSDNYGILSVIQRIDLIYGKQGNVIIESDEHGTHVMIILKGARNHAS